MAANHRAPCPPPRSQPMGGLPVMARITASYLDVNENDAILFDWKINCEGKMVYARWHADPRRWGLTGASKFWRLRSISSPNMASMVRQMRRLRRAPG